MELHLVELGLDQRDLFYEVAPCWPVPVALKDR